MERMSFEIISHENEQARETRKTCLHEQKKLYR